MLAVTTPTERRSRAACNDSGCQNVRNGGLWMITECNSPDIDGDQQLCNGVGRVGSCGSVPYCCPYYGAQWTTDMTACATQTATPTSSRTPTPSRTATPSRTPTRTPTQTPTKTPTKTPTQTPTKTPTKTPTITPTKTPTKTPTPTRAPGSTATPTRVSIYSPTPTSRFIGGSSGTVTPTPSSYILNSCNKSCSSGTDCPTGLVCAGGNIFGTGKSCRNPSCTDRFSCICDDGLVPGELTLVSPTPEPGFGGGGPTIPLSVKSFTNDSGQTGPRPTFSGTTEPGAKVTVTVHPDGVSAEVVADGSGRWSWTPEEPLSAGKKDLLVVARKGDSQGQITQPFTVVAGRGGFSWGWIILILVIVAVGFGGYVYYKSL